jgi:hypothetical protein
MIRSFLAILSATILCQCGVPSIPHCWSVPRSSRAPAQDLLAEARSNWRILSDGSRRPEWSTATTRYNTAVSKLFDQLRCGPQSWTESASLMGTRMAVPSPDLVDPASLTTVFPAATVKDGAVNQRRTTAGVGVPVVGWKRNADIGQKRDGFKPPTGSPYNLTAVLAFDAAGPPEWRFHIRWSRESITAGGTEHPLAADWTAPNAFYWHMCDLDDLAIQNVILPGRFMEETGIYFVTPYDPKKIPIVFVHGLVSSPDAFKNLINELAPEPWFRKNYQIWLYNYPTGNPWSFSSMKFREVMGEACGYARSHGGGGKLDQMVVVAHSMGGLLTHSSVVDPGKILYDANYGKPLDQLPVGPQSREHIAKTYLYKPLTEPKRVVFMAVPHRGSPTANYRVANWVSRIIRLPKTLTVDLLDATVLTLGNIVQGEDVTEHIPTSIDSLSPNHVNTKALNRIPLPGRITFHSIIGDRGKGNTPDSSDGVVPYWSSHITPVASEVIVPSGHSVQDNPKSAEELKRILTLHLGSSSLKTDN